MLEISLANTTMITVKKKHIN